MWYTGWWPSYVQCAIVTSRQISLPGYQLIRYEPAAYRQYQLAAPSLPLYLYQVDNPGCP